jgi:hypothetical protein
MNTRKLWILALILGLSVLTLNPAALRAQQQSVEPKQPVSNDKVIGTWDVEVLAEGQSYFLTMVLTQSQGQLEGKVSEQNGMFTDAVLSSLTFDGESLAFEFTGPTPPDGMPRLIQTALKVSGDTMEGSVTIPDLGVYAQAKAAKKS